MEEEEEEAPGGTPASGGAPGGTPASGGDRGRYPLHPAPCTLSRARWWTATTVTTAVTRTKRR